MKTIIIIALFCIIGCSGDCKVECQDSSGKNIYVEFFNSLKPSECNDEAKRLEENCSEYYEEQCGCTGDIIR